MSGDEVRWEEIVELGNRLARLEPEFSPEDKRALALVFNAAGDSLTGFQSALPFDARWVGGPDDGRTREAFKIEGLFRDGPATEEKPPDLKPGLFRDGPATEEKPPDLKPSKE